MWKVTVSGSFHRHIDHIYDDVKEFKHRNVKVVSPEYPVVADEINSFLFIESDFHRSIKHVQDRHLTAISISDFLWLTCPDGIIGTSASLEVGFAIAINKPIYCRTSILDSTLDKYVTKVSEPGQALRSAMRYNSQDENLKLIIDSNEAILLLHKYVDELQQKLNERITDNESKLLRNYENKIMSVF